MLNLSGMQIAMITNEEEKLVGTLTDGDIRRGLISGLNLSDPITGIVNWEPLVAPISWKGDMVLEVMRSNTIKQIPIIDDDGRVSGLHCLDDFLARPVRSNLMIIMAGGAVNECCSIPIKLRSRCYQSVVSQCLNISLCVQPAKTSEILLSQRITWVQ